MSPPSGLIGGFGAAKETPDAETTALLSSVKGEVEKVRHGVRCNVTPCVCGFQQASLL
jgi:hypothetical protein